MGNSFNEFFALLRAGADRIRQAEVKRIKRGANGDFAFQKLLGHGIGVLNMAAGIDC